jgi:8-oxo-dGTP diphosphatase
MPHIHELFDFTASAYVLHPSEPKLLLLLHKKLGKWLQPGGHIELNEDPLQALHHELIEETGLQPSDYTIIEPAKQPHVDHKVEGEYTLPLPFYFNVHRFNDAHKHIDLTYLVKAHTTKLTDNPDGALEIGWFSIDEIKAKHAAGQMFDASLQVCEWVISSQTTYL